jgi:hypothetical protein
VAIAHLCRFRFRDSQSTAPGSLPSAIVGRAFHNTIEFSIHHRCANPNHNLMFKTNLRTIAQVSAIAKAINWGCQSVPTSSQDLSPSHVTKVPRTHGDRPILRDQINTPHLDIAVPGLMSSRYLKECEHLAPYCPKKARYSHSKNVPHHGGNLYILHNQKVQARLPQFAETLQLDRVTLGRCQLKMPELSARVKDR